MYRHTYVMCIINDDAISNDITCNNVMKKTKMLEEGKGKQKKGNDEEVITIDKKKKKKMKNN